MDEDRRWREADEDVRDSEDTAMRQGGSDEHRRQRCRAEATRLNLTTRDDDLNERLWRSHSVRWLAQPTDGWAKEAVTEAAF
jgi:hypothetical protein